MMDTTDVPENLAREIRAMDKQISALRSAGAIRDTIVDKILIMLLDSLEANNVDKDTVVSAVGGYIGSHKFLTKTLISLGCSASDLESAQAAIGCLTLISIMAGSKDPNLYRQMETIIGRKRVEHARNVRSSKYLNRTIVAEIVIRTMREAALEKGGRAKIQVATRALDRVNERLAARAATLSVPPPQYKTPDNLRRIHQKLLTARKAG
jgi:hypothetical protein